MIKDNWLNTVASGSYKFTFMIVDTFQWNLAANGKFDKDSALAQKKAIIVAEDGVESAYAVQNVNIVSNTGSIRNGHATATKVTFDLLEPLGFGFLDRALTVASEFGMNQNIQAIKWVLHLEFIGRDPVTGAPVKMPDPFFYALSLQGMTGTLGEAGAKYYMEFANMDSEALKHTRTNADVTVKNVTTVSSFAEELEIALNNHIENTRPEPSGHPMLHSPLHIQYKVMLDGTATTQAQDYFGIPSFDLGAAPWGGTAEAGTQGGQSEALDELGTREIIINSETQLTAWIREKISANVPSFAEHNNIAQEYGINYEPNIKATTELVNEVDNTLNKQRKIITLRIGIITHGNVIPPNGPTIDNLRNKKDVQVQRFKDHVLPNLVKKYTYQYTGENTEVMNIDLELNTTFYTALSPAAAIYYADNSNMFEANIISNNNVGPAGGPPPGHPENIMSDSGVASARFLSDIPLQKYNINQSPIFGVSTMSASGQQMNETTDLIDKTANVALTNYAARIKDTQNLVLEVRGDPVFMGTNGKSIFDAMNTTVYMAFINFQPNPEDLLINQQRGPIDMLTTGIYKINEVVSKFQQGAFTQTVYTYREQNSSTFLLLDELMNLRVE